MLSSKFKAFSVNCKKTINNYHNILFRWLTSFWEMIIIIGVITLLLGWLKEEFPTGNWGEIVTFLAFIFAILIWNLERKYQRSEFYLNQIKEYFRETKLTLEQQSDPVKINNVKWHKMIECLKVTDKLKTELTEQKHKDIYRTDLLTILGYDFINLIGRFTEFKVFYGKYYTSFPQELQDDSYELYEATSTDLNNITRVNPNDLKFLVIFIDDLSIIYSQNENIIAQDKFDIFSKIDLSRYDAPSPSVHTKVLREYIDDFVKNKGIKI